jgi:hypothetical protein
MVSVQTIYQNGNTPTPDTLPTSTQLVTNEFEDLTCTADVSSWIRWEFLRNGYTPSDLSPTHPHIFRHVGYNKNPHTILSLNTNRIIYPTRPSLTQFSQRVIPTQLFAAGSTLTRSPPHFA